jgi:hypothetical protein
MDILDRPRSQQEASRRMNPAASASTARLQRRIRDFHLYLSMLFAPSLLFFALTGALQLFDLHESRPGASFDPPALLQELGMFHKKQVFTLPRRRGQRPPQAGQNGADAVPAAPGEAFPAKPAGDELGKSWKPLALKVFFLFASIALAISTCLGIWIGVRPGRNRRLAWSLLVTGAVVPVLLLVL